MEGANRSAVTLQHNVYSRLDQVMSELGVAWISDYEDAKFGRFMRGELVHLMVRRGDTVHIVYCQVWETRFLFDMYAKTAQPEG